MGYGAVWVMRSMGYEGFDCTSSGCFTTEDILAYIHQ
jgi:hypothetical protein